MASALNYKTETEKVSATQLNANWVRKIEQGQIKEAEQTGSAFIRTQLRQESSAREIITPVVLGDDELDRDEDTDQPKKIVEKEPDSYATFVPFYGTPESAIVKGQRYAIRFGKVVTQRWRKSKFELMTYQNDIRKILTDNGVKDMAKQEDTKFVTTVDGILTAFPAQVVAAPAWNATAFRRGFQNMVNRKVPIGKMLLTDACYLNAVDLPHTAVGDIASRHYDEGVEKEKKLWGVPAVTTIHNDVVTAHGGGSDSIYVFAPEDYLGNFFLLQDATLYIEQKADIIQFFAYEALGLGIGNTRGVTRIDVA